MVSMNLNSTSFFLIICIIHFPSFFGPQQDPAVTKFAEWQISRRNDENNSCDLRASPVFELTLGFYPTEALSRTLKLVKGVYCASSPLKKR